MSFCQNCGTQLAQGTAFCPNCGAPVQAAPQQQAYQQAPQQPIYQQAPPQAYQQQPYQPQVYQPPQQQQGYQLPPQNFIPAAPVGRRAGNVVRRGFRVSARPQARLFGIIPISTPAAIVILIILVIVCVILNKTGALS